jgi:hypothetical protein
MNFGVSMSSSLVAQPSKGLGLTSFHEGQCHRPPGPDRFFDPAGNSRQKLPSSNFRVYAKNRIPQTFAKLKA